MSRVAAIVTFQAKPGHGDEVARLVAAALPRALNEKCMPLWLVLQSEEHPDIVHIVDVFVDTEGRDNHLRDATAAQIIATVPDHLGAPLDIAPMHLITAKGL